MKRRRWRWVVLAMVASACLAACGDDGEGGTEPVVQKTFGVIEGFYGTPYAFDQRLDVMSFLPQAGLNTYVYAPKDDPYHRDRWRDPYPAEYMDHFRDLARTARTAGTRFTFALSPGLSFDPAAGDRAALEKKLGEMFDVGVRDFCLFFDDLSAGSPAADPDLQVQIVNDARVFLQSLDSKTTLCFISNFYAGTAAEIRSDHSPFIGKSSAMYAAYAAIPVDVPIFWTGPHVFSWFSVADASDFRSLVGRPMLIWDNYPVNDLVLHNELFLSPYRLHDPGIMEVAGVADGILLNAMTQPQASKIVLWTAGRLFAEGDAYDPTAALGEALKVVGGGDPAPPALARLADQFQSHPLIGSEPESTELVNRTDAFFAQRSIPTEQALRELFQDFSTTAAELDRDVANRDLAAELAEPARKLSLFGQAGLVALDLLDRKLQGDVVDDSELVALLDQANSICWLVGANTNIPTGIDVYLSGRKAQHADVFGDFFARVKAALQQN